MEVEAAEMTLTTNMKYESIVVGVRFSQTFYD